MFTYRWLTSLPELDTVQEDQADAEQLQDEIQVADHAPADEPDEARRTSANSGMSGTTAKTSFSQEEINEMDAEIMVDVLPNLAAAAEDLANLLLPSDPKARPIVRKEIRALGSKHNKLYNTRVASINVHKPSFGSTTYIHPSIVLRALLGVADMRDVSDGTWRPDAVLHMINLASMLQTVLIVVPNNNDVDDDGYNALANLCDSFGAAISGPTFDHRAFHFCLDILTQLAIIRIDRHKVDPSFDAAVAIQTTFYGLDEENDMVFRHADGLHMHGLGGEDQTTYSDAIQAVVDHLSRPFEDAAPAAALRALRARYPWEAFIQHTVEYYLERKLELNEQIEAAGGADRIKRDLNEEVDRRERTKAAEQKRQSLSRPGATPQKSVSKGGIQALKAREARLAASTAPTPAQIQDLQPAHVQAPAPTAPVAQMTAVQISGNRDAAINDDGYHEIEDDAEPRAQPTLAQTTARSALDVAIAGTQAGQRQKAAKAKGRAFIDPQPDAARVSFDDSQVQTQHQAPAGFRYPSSMVTEQRPYYHSPQRAGTKRPAIFVQEEDDDDEDGDFEPTQDQGFGDQQFDMAAADERRRTAPQQRAAPARSAPQARSTTGFGSSASAPSGTRPSATPTSAKRQRKNPGSSMPATMPPLDPDDDMEIPKEQRMQRARIAARYATATARSQKPAQVRNLWSIDEENALIALIEEHGDGGIHYAQLKAHDNEREGGPLLERRDAESMRFKARNMKQTLLK